MTNEMGGERLRIMTFNIRYDNPADGKNCFVGRRELIKSFLRREAPDVVGFQESVPVIRHWLAAELPEYEFLAVDVGDVLHNDVALAYRRDRLDLFSLDQYWLSPTPTVPDSRYPGGSPFPRMVTEATLLVRGSGKRIAVINTHLDHISDEARQWGASQMRERLRAHAPGACLLMGDFNTCPDTPPLDILLSDGELSDLTAPLGAEVATFHDFGRVTQDCKLDYIIASHAVTPFPETLKMHTDSENGIYLSDHYPISIEVEI